MFTSLSVRCGYPAKLSFAACTALIALRTAAAGPDVAQSARRNVEGIMDNSFLLEEAYNQEVGVVQHIATLFYGVNRQPGPDDEAWNLISPLGLKATPEGK